MLNFLSTYFGWQPSIAEIIWTVLLVFAGRGALFIRRKGWLENERFYWIISPIVILITLAALTYVVRGGTQPEQWPPSLTASEIDTWSTALKPFQVPHVIIEFDGAQQVGFVSTVTEAISNAGWGEPSLQLSLSVGLRIVASQDAYPAAQQIQTLCAAKIGTSLCRLGRSNPDNPGSIIMYVGWKPE